MEDWVYVEQNLFFLNKALFNLSLFNSWKFLGDILKYIIYLSWESIFKITIDSKPMSKWNGYFLKKKQFIKGLIYL